MDTERVQDLLDAIDTRSAQEFGKFLTDDVLFRFGNMPAVHGRTEVERGVAAFFVQIHGIKHSLVRVMRSGNILVAELNVCYIDSWDRELRVPVCNIMQERGGKFCDYRIFIDNSALFRAPEVSNKDI